MTPADAPWAVAVPPLVLNALLVILGALGRTDRLRRNPILGIRTPSSLRSEEAWRRAHRAAARWWIGAGAAGIALAVVAPFLPRAAVMLCLGASFSLWLLALVAGSVVGTRAARAA